MINAVIQIEVRSVYGVVKAYPVNQAAKILAQIAGTKTLCSDTLAKAQALGMVIEQVAQASFIGAIA